MKQIVDYSTGFPGAAAIRAAGYGGAVRYVGYPDRRKCTTKAELTDFTDHEIGMALVYENTTGEWRGGYVAGQAAGMRAREHANAIGFPADRPVYMAVDEDVVSESEFRSVLDYLRGAGSTLGGSGVTGLYGEADVIQRARDAGVASWFWQTAAWSRRLRVEAHLYQYAASVAIRGIDCDVNDVLAADWGQHNYTGSDDVSQADAKAALDSEKYPNLGNRSVVDGLAEVLTRLLRLTDEGFPALLDTVGGMANTLSALKDKPAAELDAEDIANVAAQFQAALDRVLDGQFEVSVTRKGDTP